nr:glycosyl transferase related to UDP-glucuronosyltransferase [uncultured Gammaproteobacteria bacterium]
MRILYGVQGTGNGHLTRARIMAKALAAAGIQVQYLFSGRPKEGFFDMEAFEDFWWYPGLTFATENGRVSYLKTLGKIPDALPFLRALRELDLTSFDLVLTDFEPITAWAAILNHKPLVGLGHQYAFRYRIPKCRGGWIARALLRWYAPATLHLGLHWHPFGQPVLPPLVEKPPLADPDPNRILVYLPFESLAAVCELLDRFPEYQFEVYSGEIKIPQNLRHIQLNPLSRQSFQESLASCSGVLCNAGFELISEALAAGKKILVKPLAGQWEQCCNAKALVQLGWGRAMAGLDVDRVADWLAHSKAVQVAYPEVATEIAAWLKGGELQVTPDWIQSIWSKADFSGKGYS